MTAHAAKGKEFDHVWVVGVEDTLFPHYLPWERPYLEEERRLLFVACSRARKRLTLSRARRRMVFGKLEENDPSELLAGLPPSVHEVHARRQTSVGEGFGGATWALPRTNANRVVARAGQVPAAATGTGPRITTEQAVVGARVRHGVFGDGDVVGTDGNFVTVKFGSATRMLSLDMAPLALITD